MCFLAHPGRGVGSENIRDGYKSAVSLPYILGSPAQHRRPSAGVSVKDLRSSDVCQVDGTVKTDKGCERYTYTLHVSPYRFDFANSNVNDEYLNKMNPHHIPDVVTLNFILLKIPSE